MNLIKINYKKLMEDMINLKENVKKISNIIL